MSVTILEALSLRHWRIGMGYPMWLVDLLWRAESGY